jgi:pilus assembly protein Flp/PilA
MTYIIRDGDESPGIQSGRSSSDLASKYYLRKEVKIMYLPREEGQGLVEYALILVLVAIVVIAILTLLGPQIANTFSKVTNGLSST